MIFLDAEYCVIVFDGPGLLFFSTQELMRMWRELEDRTISALEVLKTAATFNFQSKFDKVEQV